MISVHIEYHSNVADLPESKQIQQWVESALASQSKPCSVNIKIVDEQEMKTLNHHYRQKNKPTNVLSFPCLLPAHLSDHSLGDIAICAPIVANEAIEQNLPFYAHFAHMVIHGVLHLLGYNHEEENEAISMEALETTILHQLGFANPYGAEKIHDT